MRKRFREKWSGATGNRGEPIAPDNSGEKEFPAVSQIRVRHSQSVSVFARRAAESFTECSAGAIRTGNGIWEEVSDADETKLLTALRSLCRLGPIFTLAIGINPMRGCPHIRREMQRRRKVKA